MGDQLEGVKMTTDKISITYSKITQIYIVTSPTGQRDSVFSQERALRMAAQQYHDLKSRGRAPRGGVIVEFDPSNLTGISQPKITLFGDY